MDVRRKISSSCFTWARLFLRWQSLLCLTERRWSVVGRGVLVMDSKLGWGNDVRLLFMHTTFEYFNGPILPIRSHSCQKPRCHSKSRLPCLTGGSPFDEDNGVPSNSFDNSQMTLSASPQPKAPPPSPHNHRHPRHIRSIRFTENHQYKLKAQQPQSRLPRPQNQLILTPLWRATLSTQEYQQFYHCVHKNSPRLKKTYYVKALKFMQLRYIEKGNKPYSEHQNACKNKKQQKNKIQKLQTGSLYRQTHFSDPFWRIKNISALRIGQTFSALIMTRNTLWSAAVWAWNTLES